MQQGERENRQLTEVDRAYYALRESGKPKYYKELIIDVLTTQGKIMTSSLQGTLISGVYTQITMDSRFVHLGKGIWGLSEWYPKRGGPNLAELQETKENNYLRRDRMLLAEIQEVYTTEEQTEEFEKKFDETD